ncbi:MAG: HAD family hydrolase [Ignavibacteria bacterium]|nr:HAD family hydrolase [Ignavibacteria bacterium]
MKKLLLFDIDSTLITMERTAQRAIMSHASKRAFGYDIPENAVPQLSGKTDRQIIAEINANLGLSIASLEFITNEFLEGLREITPKFSTPFTVQALGGVVEIVEYFHHHSDVTLGLVTGNNRECAFFKLSPIGLDKYFSVGAFGCDHHDRRLLPPIAMQRAMDEVGLHTFTSDNTLIIGDAPGDIACAHANEIPILAVATGRYSFDELRDLGADAVLEDLSNTSKSISTINRLLNIYT